MISTESTHPERSAPDGAPWRRRSLTGLLAALLLQFGCGGGRGPRVEAPVEATVGSRQEGIASWYGHPYHGRRTANGEVYDMESPTAAHKTLPFDTWVKVTNLDNRRSTTVRINDRGPFVTGRIIDLSRRAAREVDMLRSGTAPVRLEVVRAPGRSAPARFTVQVGSFRRRGNAERLRQRLRRDFDPVFIEENGPFYRVRVGRLYSRSEAERLAARLRRQRDLQSAVVVRL